MLSRGDEIVPLIGARTVERLAEGVATPLKLSAAALASIEDAVPLEEVQGDRLMAH